MKRPDRLYKIYSEVEKEKRTVAGVGMVVYKKHKNQIEQYKYIPERIIAAKIKSGQHHALNIVSVYSPENRKPKNKSLL